MPSTSTNGVPPMASSMLFDRPFLIQTSYSGVTYAPERPPSTKNVEAFT